jgi:hypothetical protein
MKTMYETPRFKTPRFPRASWWPFAGLCAYLASQAFTVPVLAVGPSWTVWPTLCDLASCFLVGATFISLAGTSYLAASRKQKILLSVLILILGEYGLSFLVHYVWTDSLPVGRPDPLRAVQYQLYRLAQFSLIYWASINVPLTTKRINVLRRILLCVLIVVCLGLILEFIGIVEPAVYVSHLPKNPNIAGA